MSTQHIGADGVVRISDRHTYWVSIGRNTKNGPLNTGEWIGFRSAVHNDISHACGGQVITTVDGINEGSGDHTDWDGEETHLILFTIAPEYVTPLRHRLAFTALRFYQEAIGFVGGASAETLILADI